MKSERHCCQVRRASTERGSAVNYALSRQVLLDSGPSPSSPSILTNATADNERITRVLVVRAPTLTRFCPVDLWDCLSVFVGWAYVRLTSAFTFTHPHPPLSHFPSPFPTMASKAAQKRVCILPIAFVSLAQRPRLAIQGIYHHAEGVPALRLGSP